MDSENSKEAYEDIWEGYESSILSSYNQNFDRNNSKERLNIPDRKQNCSPYFYDNGLTKGIDSSVSVKEEDLLNMSKESFKNTIEVEQELK